MIIFVRIHLGYATSIYDDCVFAPDYLYYVLILLTLQYHLCSIIHDPCSGTYGTVPFPASNIHYAPTRKWHSALKINMNTECLSNPEVAGCSPNIVPGSAGWHVACKCVLIKCKLIRLIELDICVLQCN